MPLHKKYRRKPPKRFFRGTPDFDGSLYRDISHEECKRELVKRLTDLFQAVEEDEVMYVTEIIQPEIDTAWQKLYRCISDLENKGHPNPLKEE
jgi:hypothetical protein